jgi:hypothetical protein
MKAFQDTAGGRRNNEQRIRPTLNRAGMEPHIAVLRNKDLEA